MDPSKITDFSDARQGQTVTSGLSWALVSKGLGPDHATAGRERGVMLRRTLAGRLNAGPTHPGSTALGEWGNRFEMHLGAARGYPPEAALRCPQPD